MNAQIYLFLVGLVYVVGALIVSIKYIEGGFINTLQMTALVLPLVLILVNKMRPYWFIFVIGYYTFFNPTIDAPLFDAMGGTTPVMLMLIGAYCIADLAMHKTGIFLRASWVNRAMLILAWFITIRFAVHPAGSARLGESGGLARTLPMLMSTWMFFVAYWVTRYTEHFKTCFIWVFTAAFFSMFYSFFSKMATEGAYLGHFYDWRNWLLIGAALAGVSVYVRHKGVAGLLFFALSSLTVILSLINPHRSRITFAVIALLAWGVMTKRLVRVGVLTLVLFALPIAILVGIEGKEGVPDVFKRPLSLFTTVHVGDTSIGELGWISDFRAQLYRASWEEIKEQPLVGNGFRFSRAELLEQLGMQSQMGILSTVKSYHNSLLFMATAIGLPMTALFALVFLYIFIKGLLWVRRHPNDRYRFIAMLVLIYLIPATGQLLMNGGTRDVLNACILLGVLLAALDRGNLETAAAKEVAQAVPATVPFSAHRIAALQTPH